MPQEDMNCERANFRLQSLSCGTCSVKHIDNHFDRGQKATGSLVQEWIYIMASELFVWHL